MMWFRLLVCCLSAAAAEDPSVLIRELLAEQARLQHEQARLSSRVEALRADVPGVPAPRAEDPWRGRSSAIDENGPLAIEAAGVEARPAEALPRGLSGAAEEEDELLAAEAAIARLPDGTVKDALQQLLVVAEQVDAATADIRSCLDYLWILICGAMVTFMQAGFAMLEAGACSHASAGVTLLKNVMDACLGALVWYSFGYGFAYGVPDHPNEFIGSGNFFGIGFDDDGSRHKLDWFFQFAFCATSATIVSGAVAERIQLFGYLVFAVFMTSFIYPVIVWWTWSGYGFLTNLGYSDFAGSGTVHFTGAVSAFVGAKILGPRRGRFDDPAHNPFVANNMAMSVLGTLTLWFGWYGFNCGSTLSFSDIATVQQAALVAMNSTLSAGVGGALALFTRFWECGKLDLLATCNGILSGLVAVCAGCADMNPPAAIFTGMCGSLAMMTLSKVVVLFRVDDPLDAVAVHGGGGLVGLLTYPLLSMQGVQGEMLKAHLLGALCIALWSGFWTALIFVVLKKLDLLRVSEVEELLGLDAKMLGDHIRPGQLVSGSRIVATNSFESNDKKNRATIKPGTFGTVKQVDEDGDVRIDFDDMGLHWVLKDNFKNMRMSGEPDTNVAPGPDAKIMDVMHRDAAMGTSIWPSPGTPSTMCSPPVSSRRGSFSSTTSSKGKGKGLMGMKRQTS